jgi:hypothetical protein
VGAAVLTTRDLFGRSAALLVGALLAVEWTTTLYGSRQGYSENLILITLILTLWSILRSVKDERYILFAGLFAGLGYLSKASIGWFFLIAGLGGLAWRLWHRGWAVLRNRHYLGAIGIFGLFVGSWSLRNLALFWDGTPAGLLTDWQTSVVTGEKIVYAFQHPALLAIGLVGKFPILLFGTLLPVAPLLPSIARAFREWRREDVSGLWLAAVLLFVLGWLFAATFWVAEGLALRWGDPIRYVAPAAVPLAWMVFLVPEARATARAWTWSLILGILAVVVMPKLVHPGGPLGP